MTTPINTIVFPIIRQDFVLRALETLGRHTPPNFRTIVVNQSVPNQGFEEALYEAADMVIKTQKNYGFAQASNTGIRLALPNAEVELDLYREAGLIIESRGNFRPVPTPYVTICNDDVEFIPAEPTWWGGILETFDRFPKAAAVNPQSAKEPGWGWGEPGYRYLVSPEYTDYDLVEAWAEWELERRDYCIVRDKVREERKEMGTESGEARLALQQSSQRLLADADILAPLVYDRASNDPEFTRLLIEGRNWQVVDAFAMFCPVFRTDRLEMIGLLDERFIPGGGEDYDWMSRCYSSGFRALSSSHSWIWHWWGQSKDEPTGHDTALPLARPPWNKLSVRGFKEEGLWDPDVDVWGKSGVRTDEKIYRASL